MTTVQLDQGRPRGSRAEPNPRSGKPGELQGTYPGRRTVLHTASSVDVLIVSSAIPVGGLEECGVVQNGSPIAS